MANLTLKNQGELVQFLSDGKADIRSLKVHFTPKQAGEGTPSPENVREISGWNGVEVYHCGKNIANLNSDKMLSYAWTRAFPNPFKKAGKYTISCQNQIIASGQLGAFVFLGNAVTDNSGYGLTGWTFGGSVMRVVFNITEAALNNKYIIFRFNGNPTYNSIANAKIQIEEGIITATSYEPYNSNIRLPNEYQEVEYLKSTGTQYIELPFGFDYTDEVKICGSMENGFGDKYMVAPKTWNTDSNRFLMLGGVNGMFVFSFGTRGTPNSTLKPQMSGDTQIHTMTYSNKVFTVVDTGSVADMSALSFGSTTANLRLFYGYNSNTKGKIVSYHHKKVDGTEINLVPCYRKSDKVAGMYDSVSKTFYTNQGTGEFLVGPSVNKYDVDWTEELGSVYGGYVDLVSGEICQTWKTISYDGTTDAIRSQSSYQRFSMLADADGRLLYERTNPNHIKCDKLLNIGANGMGNPTYRIAVVSAYQIQVKITEDVDTPELLLEWLNENPIQVAVKLATPITHQLSPDILKTLTGKNTFWSNADYIEIEYDLIETQQTWMNRIHMVNSMQPHIEAASGSLVSFKTDMASKLKECKIHFTPIQEGSGDPSPDNVRPIRGWDGVTVYTDGKYYADTDKIFDEGVLTGTAEKIVIYDFSVKNGTYTVYTDVPNNSSQSIASVFAANGKLRTPTSGSNGVFVNAPRTVTVTNGLLSLGIRTGSGIYLTWNKQTFAPYYILIERDKSEIDASHKITIPFPQTIYGGYVDLVKGEVVETYVSRKINTANFGARLYTHSATGYKGSYNYYTSGGLADFPIALSAATYMCDRLSIGADATQKAYTLNTFGNRGYIYVYADPNELSEETLSALRAYLSDLDPQFVYKVRNETDYTAYSLDPVTIRTLKGLNNVWSDANGNIEIKYWKR